MNNRSGQNEVFDVLYQNEVQTKRGKLKIFFGISPGVGKTSSMLEAARTEIAKGVRVVVARLEYYAHSETFTLPDVVAVIPPKKTEYKGAFFDDIDLDAVIEMNPQLVLVTNLSHTNTPVSRNLKRYQDIQELLVKGIDVYTTLSMIHLESCADIVSQKTGLNISQTLPDEIFEQADDVEFIDIAPEILINRLAKGKASMYEHSTDAFKNFLHKDILSALRTITLHKILERDNKQGKHVPVLRKMTQLMLLITSAPESMQLIRRIKTVAEQSGTDWIALYVEPNYKLTETEKKQLAINFNLVRKLKGDLITFSGNNLVKTILEVARRENVTHIIVGKSKRKWISRLMKKNIAYQLIKKSDTASIIVSILYAENNQDTTNTFNFISIVPRFRKYIITMIFAVVIALLCVPLAGKTSNPYLPVVMLLALVIPASYFRKGVFFMITALALLAFGVFLIPPRFTFYFDTTQDTNIFLAFFAVSLLIGMLTARFREQEIQSSHREKQTNALFHLNKRLGNATSIREVVEASADNIQKFFSSDAFFLFRNNKTQLTNLMYVPQGITFSESEMETAAKAFKGDRITGKFTDIEPSSKYTFYPLKGPSVQIGVVALKLNKSLSGKDSIFWDAFLAQITQSLEHQYLGHLASQTALLNESDKLFKTLFNSISHELRIPVATIMGASDILLAPQHPENIRTKLYGEILEASKRLNRLIDNLLNMSRLESGRLAVHLDWCDVHDLFNRVTENLAEELRVFRLDIVIPESMPLVRLDFGLMEQVLYNLMYNSSIYAQPGTTMRMKAMYNNGLLVLQVMDRGEQGFNTNELPYIFDKFWRQKSDKTGGLGLGLSIVKGFVEAHKGTVAVENRKNGGVRFTMTIPVEISNESENE